MNRKEITPEYVYITIPAEYVCVYHRILAMLADYGEEMLKDCKAGCTDKNSGVIECFNMFNAAIAARHLNQNKKAELIINYIKAKINQIYKGKDNSTGFVFPIDENGVLKAFVSCNDRPRFVDGNNEEGGPTFIVDTDDLYKIPQGLGVDEEYSLDDENNPEYNNPFDFECEAEYENNRIVTNLTFTYNKFPLREEELQDVRYEFYVNQIFVPDLSTFEVPGNITVSLRVVAYFRGLVNNHTYAVNLV